MVFVLSYFISLTEEKCKSLIADEESCLPQSEKNRNNKTKRKKIHLMALLCCLLLTDGTFSISFSFVPLNGANFILIRNYLGGFAVDFLRLLAFEKVQDVLSYNV